MSGRDERGAGKREGDAGDGTRRLRETIRGLLGSVEESALDGATDWVDASLQRWGEATGLRRFGQVPGRDQLTRVGEPVELSAPVGALRRGRVDHVRFHAGGRTLGEAPVERDGIARLIWTPDARATLVVEATPVGKSGRSFERPASRLVLQVVEDEPVAAVDVHDVLGASPARDRELRALAERGWAVCYFDLAVEQRSAEAHEAIAARGLPPGAVLSHAADEIDFPTLGVDFRRVFATTTLRRVRARGAAVALVLSSDATTVEGCAAEDVAGAATLPDEATLVELEAGARAPGGGRLAAMTRAPLREGQALHVELDNHAAREALFAAIDEAKERVHLQLYIVQPARFTDQLAVRLILAARRGVRVRLLVDALYSGERVLGLSNPLVNGLGQEPGIEVHAGDPIESPGDLEPLRLKNRDHRKLAIVDGARAFVSGRNAGDEYYTGFDEVAVFDFTPHEHIPWLDAHVELRGPLVADVERCFRGAWTRAGGDAFEVETPAPAGESAARLVVHLGVQDANGLLAYEALFDGAEDHIYVVNDFPVVDTLASAVRRAVHRGVRVRFLTGSGLARRADGSFFPGPRHRELFEYLTKRRLEPLMEAGVEAFEYATPPLEEVVARGGIVRPYVHAKLVTADGRIASVGSANLDATASYWEREANVVIEDPTVVGELEGRLEAMIATSHPLDLGSEAWAREATKRDLVARLWPEAFYS